MLGRGSVVAGTGGVFSRGVSLSVAAGEFVGVLGGRGQGKTTLMELAAGLIVPEAGHVWFGDSTCGVSSDDERSELRGDRIVWLPREDMADFDVLSYVALPLAMGPRPRYGNAEDRARDALRRVGVEGREHWHWEELSDWERLLVALARGYAARPKLMVVDDLLDTFGAGGAREAGELLLELTREFQCGVLVTASHMSALLAADRVLCFDGNGGLTPVEETTNVVDFPGTARAS